MAMGRRLVVRQADLCDPFGDHAHADLRIGGLRRELDRRRAGRAAW